METVHTAFTMHTWYDACGTLKLLSTHITRSYYFLVENYANPFAMLQGVWYVVVAVLSLLVAVLIAALYRSVNVSLSYIGRKRLTVVNIEVPVYLHNRGLYSLQRLIHSGTYSGRVIGPYHASLSSVGSPRSVSSLGKADSTHL